MDSKNPKKLSKLIVRKVEFLSYFKHMCSGEIRSFLTKHMLKIKFKFETNFKAFEITLHRNAFKLASKINFELKLNFEHVLC